MPKQSDLTNSMMTDVSKRHALKLIAVTPLLLTPLNSQAGFWGFLGTQAARFVGGLLFDSAASILVKVVRGAFSSSYRGYSSGSVSYYDSLPRGETDFYHAGYKVAVSRLGLSDAEYDESRIVRLNLKGDENLSRFESVHRYLYDNKIRIVPAKGNYSRGVTLKTIPDDLFTIEGFVFDTNETESIRQYHYTQLLRVTQNQAFKRWLV